MFDVIQSSPEKVVLSNTEDKTETVTVVYNNSNISSVKFHKADDTGKTYGSILIQ